MGQGPIKGPGPYLRALFIIYQLFIIYHQLFIIYLLLIIYYLLFIYLLWGAIASGASHCERSELSPSLRGVPVPEARD